jgi:hypothetical protein
MHTIRFGVVGLLAAVLLVTLSSGALAADANGTWKWTVEGRRGSQDFTAVIKVEGDKVTGTVTVPFGDSGTTPIKNGTFKNDELNFETVMDLRGNELTTKYKGKVEGDTIKGKTERPGRGGEMMSQDWNATREKK